MKKSKIKKAVALKYEKTYKAPLIIAKGRGIVADKIIETAEKEKIPITKDVYVVEELMKREIGEEIPEELYRAVAGILAYIYSIDKTRGE